MPIKGLSEVRRFSRGGKIRLGEKRTSNKNGREVEYPAKLDHFLFDPDDESLIPEFNRIYGDKPKQLKICFPSDDLETVFPQHYKCYGSSGLLCKGDGEMATRFGQGEDESVSCPGPSECAFATAHGVSGKTGCKQVASLQFFLPDLPVMQTFQIDTTSYNSIIKLNSAINLLQTLKSGRISFIPVDLVLREQEATNPESGKKITIYVMDIVIPVGLRQIHGSLKSLLGPNGEAPLALPPAEDRAPDDLYPRSQIAPPVEITMTASAPASPSREESMQAVKDMMKRLEITRDDAAAWMCETLGKSTLKDLDDIALAAIPAALEAHFGMPAQPEPEAPADDLFGDEAHATPAPAEAQAAPTTDEGW